MKKQKAASDIVDGAGRIIVFAAFNNWVGAVGQKSLGFGKLNEMVSM